MSEEAKQIVREFISLTFKESQFPCQNVVVRGLMEYFSFHGLVAHCLPFIDCLL